jgi:hypothetical protein
MMEFWRMEDGGERRKDDGFLEDGKRRMEKGGWSLDGGKRRMELGWRRKDFWRMEKG